MLRKNLLDHRERILVKLAVVLHNGGLAVTGGEALFDATDEVARQTCEGLVDPPLLMLDVHQIDHAAEHFKVSHVLQVNTLSSLVTTKPWLLEVVIKFLNDVLPLFL